MGKHKRIRDDKVTKTVLAFDAEAARLDAEHAKKVEAMGPVEKATHKAETRRKSWGRRE